MSKFALISRRSLAAMAVGLTALFGTPAAEAQQKVRQLKSDISLAEEELKRSSVECGRSNAVAVHGSTGGEFSTDQGRPVRRDRGLHSGWSTSRRP